MVLLVFVSLQADIHLSDGSWYRAAVPSGASTGEWLSFRGLHVVPSHRLGAFDTWNLVHSWRSLGKKRRGLIFVDRRVWLCRFVKVYTRRWS